MSERLTLPQKHSLLYVNRYETPDFGVIIPYATAVALTRKELATAAPRRRYSRDTGACVRLTEKGKQWVAE